MWRCKMPPPEGVKDITQWKMWRSYEQPRMKLSDVDIAQLCWVVEIRLKHTNDSPARSEKFVLFKALSLLRGHVVLGRATRVWQAWKWEDIVRKVDDREVRFTLALVGD